MQEVFALIHSTAFIARWQGLDMNFGALKSAFKAPTSYHRINKINPSVIHFLRKKKAVNKQEQSHTKCVH